MPCQAHTYKDFGSGHFSKKIVGSPWCLRCLTIVTILIQYLGSDEYVGSGQGSLRPTGRSQTAELTDISPPAMQPAPRPPAHPWSKPPSVHNSPAKKTAHPPTLLELAAMSPLRSPSTPKWHMAPPDILDDLHQQSQSQPRDFTPAAISAAVEDRDDSNSFYSTADDSVLDAVSICVFFALGAWKFVVIRFAS